MDQEQGSTRPEWHSQNGRTIAALVVSGEVDRDEAEAFVQQRALRKFTRQLRVAEQAKDRS
jgi:hypothetical protein